MQDIFEMLVSCFSQNFILPYIYIEQKPLSRFGRYRVQEDPRLPSPHFEFKSPADFEDNKTAMAAAYSIELYLLDRANIEDTMVRMVSDLLTSLFPSFRLGGI